MSNVYVYQIHYSDLTRGQLDPGFLPLDNSTNQRPDWREYWPIRRFLLGNRLEDAYYGFFSPRFRDKSTLESARVHDYLRREARGADVVLFSPYFDQSAMFWNTLEECTRVHRDAHSMFLECAKLIAPTFHLDDTVNTSANTVYCNYFVAKPQFWRLWLETCERIYAVAEAFDTELGRQLNAGITYELGTAPAKVFVIERVASMLLATDPRWRVLAYRPATRFSRAPIAAFTKQLIALDALKIAYLTYFQPEYRDTFTHLRLAMINALAKRGP